MLVNLALLKEADKHAAISDCGRICGESREYSIPGNCIKTALHCSNKIQDDFLSFLLGADEAADSTGQNSSQPVHKNRSDISSITEVMLLSAEAIRKSRAHQPQQEGCSFESHRLMKQAPCVHTNKPNDYGDMQRKELALNKDSFIFDLTEKNRFSAFKVVPKPRRDDPLDVPSIEKDAIQHPGFVDEEVLNVLKDVVDPPMTQILDVAAIEEEHPGYVNQEQLTPKLEISILSASIKRDDFGSNLPYHHHSLPQQQVPQYCSTNIHGRDNIISSPFHLERWKPR